MGVYWFSIITHCRITAGGAKRSYEDAIFESQDEDFRGGTVADQRDIQGYCCWGSDKGFETSECCGQEESSAWTCWSYFTPNGKHGMV